MTDKPSETKGVVTEVEAIREISGKSKKTGNDYTFFATKIHLEGGATIDASAFKRKELEEWLSIVKLRDRIAVLTVKEGNYLKADLGSPVSIIEESVGPSKESPAGYSYQGVPAEVWDAKDRRVARESAIKSAVGFAQALAEMGDKSSIKTTDDLLIVAGRFEKWIYRDDKEGAQ